MSAVRTETRRLAVLAGPVIVAQVGNMALNTVDTIMVGHLGAEALAAVMLGHLWMLMTLMPAFGLVNGVDPIITQAEGRRDAAGLGLGLQRGLWASFLISLPVAASWLFVEPGLALLRQDPDLARLSVGYVYAQLPAAPVFLWFLVLRQYLMGRGIVRPAMWIVLAANPLNVLFNWAFIYGHLGVPPLGTVGAGLATLLTRTLMLAALAVVMVRGNLLAGGWIPWSRASFTLRGLGEIFHHGIPVGLQMSFELWAFQFATLFAGRLGTIPLAAHTVAINLLALFYMVPMGFSLAAVTRVGNLIGERRPHRAQVAAWCAFGLAGGAALLSAVLFVILRDLLPRVYTADLTVVTVAASVLPIAACFQVFDALQAVGGGVLRGMGRTRPAAVIHFLGFYAFALPLGWYLAFPRGMGLPGVWWGLAAGLAVAGLLLVGWIARRGPAHLARRAASPGAA